jgi:hypothetical protein
MFTCLISSMSCLSSSSEQVLVRHAERVRQNMSLRLTFFFPLPSSSLETLSNMNDF